MSEIIRVTVAPLCHVTIPHPAGVAALPSLTLGQGNTVDVTPARAAQLYRAGLILHPVTGALPPTPEPMRETGMTITIGDGPPQPADGGAIQIKPASEALVLPASPFELIPQANHEHGLMPRTSVTTYGSRSSDPMSTITTADDRPWPSF